MQSWRLLIVKKLREALNNIKQSKVQEAVSNNRIELSIEFESIDKDLTNEK